VCLSQVARDQLHRLRALADQERNKAGEMAQSEHAAIGARLFLDIGKYIGV
jgi:hypothetical protein